MAHKLPNQDSFQDFAEAVGKQVLKHYGETDGADYCYTLLEQGVVRLDMSHSRAAQIVVQHLQQA